MVFIRQGMLKDKTSTWFVFDCLFQRMKASLMLTLIFGGLNCGWTVMGVNISEWDLAHENLDFGKSPPLLSHCLGRKTLNIRIYSRLVMGCLISKMCTSNVENIRICFWENKEQGRAHDTCPGPSTDLCFSLWNTNFISLIASPFPCLLLNPCTCPSKNLHYPSMIVCFLFMAW